MVETRIDSRMPADARLWPPQPCAKLGCAAPADWQLGIRATAAGALGAVLADAWIASAVCETHKPQVTIDVLLPADCRQGFLAQLEDEGVAVPAEADVFPIFALLVAGSA